MKQLYKHCVLIASNYTSGKRIALHFLYNEANINDIKNIINEYATYRGVSIYSINTDSPEIASVKKKEPFFENVVILDGHVLENQKTFRDVADNQVDAYDFALLLLARDAMTYNELLHYLFFIYVEAQAKFGICIFENAVKLDHHKIIINKLLKDKIVPENSSENSTMICRKENVVMSRFFNNKDGGVELMNLALLLYQNLREIDFSTLTKKINDIWAQLITKHRNKTNVYFINKKIIKNNLTLFSVLQ